jgi:hypothetical protein
MDCVVTSLTNRTKCMVTHTFYAKSVCVIKFRNTVIIKTVFTHNDLSKTIRYSLVNTVIDSRVSAQHLYPIYHMYLSTAGKIPTSGKTEIINRNFMSAASFPIFD